ncbi:hypothetical protein THOM_3072 [Trachipleistophora hominis]|uniref:Uncharacterized protein n=1 Tax=Trachipleistophora hominis TaxID=72359 RepID=L7JRT9_TRAHO|nr:hypothetical protein THOM_3072 [Trachipleistophora hominis]
MSDYAPCVCTRFDAWVGKTIVIFSHSIDTCIANEVTAHNKIYVYS